MKTEIALFNNIIVYTPNFWDTIDDFSNILCTLVKLYTYVRSTKMTQNGRGKRENSLAKFAFIQLPPKWSYPEPKNLNSVK